MSTYRHVITLNSAHATAKDINELHKLVMAGYLHAVSNTPDARSALNILFHTQPATIDAKTYPPRATNMHKLLVQADVPGDWTNTPYAADRILGLHVGPAIPVDNAVKVGSTVEITAHLNATRTTSDRSSPRGRGRRHAITKADDVIDWADRTFAGRGLDLDRSTITVGKPLRYVGHKRSQSASSKLTQIIVDGRPITATGVVTDPEALRNAFVAGVGHGRAYGTGLIRHRAAA